MVSCCEESVKRADTHEVWTVHASCAPTMAIVSLRRSSVDHARPPSERRRIGAKSSSRSVSSGAEKTSAERASAGESRPRRVRRCPNAGRPCSRTSGDEHPPERSSFGRSEEQPIGACAAAAPLRSAASDSVSSARRSRAWGARCRGKGRTDQSRTVGMPDRAPQVSCALRACAGKRNMKPRRWRRGVRAAGKARAGAGPAGRWRRPGACGRAQRGQTH